MPPVPAAPDRRLRPFFLARAMVCLVALALLQACAGGERMNAAGDARHYRAHARGNYTPPGPPEDPWGPYIVSASRRFDVPERWIREVMRVESGGNLYLNGDLVTSGAGAMGLMQVMPGTYAELSERHQLGDDAYDPRNNILAGAAYIREMYDIYGAPGFLAAYNGGPKRLDDYLAGLRTMPEETRRYVAKIGPYIADTFPHSRSPAEQYAMNALPINVPPGLRNSRQFAQQRGGTAGARGPVLVAQLPAPPTRTGGTLSLAAATPQPPPRGGFQLIPSAIAAPAPALRGGGGSQWAIQVGAFSSENMARIAAGKAREHARDALAAARPQVSGVRQGHNTLYRARLVGLSREAATQACERLTHNRATCVVLSPEAQS